jgi:hypothetical protein
VGYLLLVDRSPSDTVRQVERKFLHFIIKALSISGVTWEWHFLNHAKMIMA